MQVLDKADLDLAIADSQYSVQEVSEWSGCRGLIVAVHDESIRVDFSTELLRRARDAEIEAVKLRSVISGENVAANELRSELDQQKVRVGDLVCSAQYQSEPTYSVTLRDCLLSITFYDVFYTGRESHIAGRN